MKQPKFKLGEMVKVKERPLRHFTIRSIAQFADGFAYSEDTWAKSFEGENSLEIYQESQKKKLYAYKKWNQFHLGGSEMCNGHEIVFVTDIDLPRMSKMDRAPEFDIEYPETK